MQFENNDYRAPKAKLESFYHEDGFFVVEVARIDLPFVFHNADYYMEYENGMAVQGEQGAVDDIYCLDMYF